MPEIKERNDYDYLFTNEGLILSSEEFKFYLTSRV
jgi:hypothetical protein